MSPAQKGNKHHKDGSGAGFWVFRILGSLLLVLLTTTVILALFATIYIKNCIQPNVKLNLKDFLMNKSSEIYYTDPDTGQPVKLQNLTGDPNRVWVKYEDMPKALEYAAVSIEDKRFYKHNGVDWYRTSGAFFNMFLGMKDNFGGSTITQQLIKNLTSEDQVTVQRKILEIFRALEFEKNYTKEEIMEWYLNNIYLGEGCYGVNSAALTYFDKSAKDLTVAECASLISITNNPSKYDPYISAERNKERQELILAVMYEQKYITKDQYDEAMAQQLVFKRAEASQPKTAVYSYYVDQVISDVIADLMKEWDISYNAATELLYSGGYKIYCNMNPKVQEAVDHVYQNAKNLPYHSSSGQQLQSGITVIDPYTGYVVAISGGMGEKTSSRSWSRATNTIRPPGSSIKPLSVYAPALELGLITPATVFDDTPYSVIGRNAWPVNVDGIYSGLTTVTNAVRVSKNTVAVKVLSKVTPRYAYDFLTQKMGITSLVAQREINGETYSDINLAPLALGGLTDGVSTREMAAAYAAFINKGVYTDSTTYSKVLDNDGNLVLDNKPDTVTAVSEKTCFYINELLEGVVSSGTGTNAKFSGMTIAGKTGTTSSKKDTWFVGYTPYYVAAVWVGYDMQEKINASTNQAPILWKKVMSQVHSGLENKAFDQPAGVKKVSYCLDSGLLPTSACRNDLRGSRVTSGYFFPEDVPRKYCGMHESVEVCVHTEMDESGNLTTKTYLKGPYCPDATVKTVSVLNYTRELVKSGVTVQDYKYTLAALTARGECPYHTSPISGILDGLFPGTSGGALPGESPATTGFPSQTGSGAAPSSQRNAREHPDDSAA